MKPLSLTLAALLLAATLASCGPAANPPETLPTDPTATTLSGGILLPNGRLPDGAYTPPAAAPRYYSQPTYTLIPRDDYGRIWPYVGGYTIAYHPNSWRSDVQTFYGLCDENGKIICDPIFKYVSIIERDGAQLYLLTKQVPSVAHESGYHSRHMLDMVTRTYTLATLDGSWSIVVSDFQMFSHSHNEWHNDYFYGWGDFLRYQYITAQKDGKWGVLDFDGTLLLPFVYHEPVCFSEGLAAVLSDNGASVSFIDITGAVVLGPYDAPPRQKESGALSSTPLPLTYRLAFVDGVCRVYDAESGLFGLIDREGQVVLPPQYDYITCFNGQMAQFLKGEYNGILNTDGVEIFSRLATNARLTRVDGGVVIDHKELLSPDGTRVPYDTEDAPFPLPDNCHVYNALENGTFLFILDDGDYCWQLYDEHGSPLSPKRDGYANRDGQYIFVDDSIDDSDLRFHQIYNLDGTPLFSGAYAGLTLFDNRFFAREEHYAGLLDESGNWVIRVPIFDYNPD